MHTKSTFTFVTSWSGWCYLPFTDEETEAWKVPWYAPSSNIKLVKEAGLISKLYILNHRDIIQWLHNNDYFRVAYWVEGTVLYTFQGDFTPGMPYVQALRGLRWGRWERAGNSRWESQTGWALKGRLYLIINRKVKRVTWGGKKQRGKSMGVEG